MSQGLPTGMIKIRYGTRTGDAVGAQNARNSPLLDVTDYHRQTPKIHTRVRRSLRWRVSAYGDNRNKFTSIGLSGTGTSRGQVVDGRSGVTTRGTPVHPDWHSTRHSSCGQRSGFSFIYHGPLHRGRQHANRRQEGIEPPPQTYVVCGEIYPTRPTRTKIRVRRVSGNSGHRGGSTVITVQPCVRNSPARPAYRRLARTTAPRQGLSDHRLRVSTMGRPARTVVWQSKRSTLRKRSAPIAR